MKSYIIIAIILLGTTTVFAQKIQIATVQSVYIETYRDTQRLGSGTGFIIRSRSNPYLVTNWHIATNKNAWNNQWMDSKVKITPNKIKITHNSDVLGSHIDKWENLTSVDGKIRYFQDKIGAEMVDVVELPLTDTVGIKIYPVDYNSEAKTNVMIQVTDRVFILGYPLGIRSAPSFPVWKSGLIASEPAVNQEGKPVMWVDALTYPGMSGSPVYFVGDEYTTKDGSRNMLVGNATIFLGVFSHMNIYGVYGALWKAEFVKTIFDRLP